MEAIYWISPQMNQTAKSAEQNAAHGTKGALFVVVGKRGVSVAFNKFQFPFCPVS